MRQGDQTKNCNMKRDRFKIKENFMQSKDHRINKTKGTGNVLLVLKYGLCLKKWKRESMQQRILRIGWESHTTKEEVVIKADTERKLMKTQLRSNTYSSLDIACEKTDWKS